MSPYLEVARQGKNNWWRFLLSFLLILFMWFFIGSMPYLLLMAYAGLDGSPATYVTVQGPVGFDPLPVFVATMLSFVPLLLTTLFVVRFIHQRSARTLITAAPKIRWWRVAAAFGVWLGLSALMSVLEELLHPGRYQLTFQPAAFLAFLAPALVLLAIQTASEELFLRGYLMQGLGLVVRRGWLVAVITSLIFAGLHWGNPEVSVDAGLLMAYYFSFGLFAALISLRDGGLELALGIHASNNIFAALLANYKGSAITSPSIFTAGVLDPVYGLVAPLLGMGIFYLIFFVLMSPGPLAESSGMSG
jgi:membrane protease YdiL (CAAX protease family)